MVFEGVNPLLRALAQPCQFASPARVHREWEEKQYVAATQHFLHFYYWLFWQIIRIHNLTVTPILLSHFLH